MKIIKYMIEKTENGCVETVIFSDGRQYSKRHTKYECSSTIEDDEFHEQMERDGICEEILRKVYDLFDGFFASDFMDIAELDN